MRKQDCQAFLIFAKYWHHVNNFPMHRFKATIIFLSIVLTVNAQQLPIFTQYRENAGYINPASLPGNYFVYNTNMALGMSYRLQWIGMKNPPKTQIIHGDFMSTGLNTNILSGFTLVNDQTGPTGFTGLYGRIGSVISENPEYGGFSAALSLGLVQFQLRATDLILRDDNDILATEDRRKLFPDAGLGIYGWKLLDWGGRSEDYIYGGISIPQVLGLDLSLSDPNGDIAVSRVRHYYANAGLYHFFSDFSFIESSVWVKYVPNAPVNADLNIRYQINEFFWLGIGASSQANLHAETGFCIGDLRDSAFRIGYGFDYSFSSWGPLAGTTHEINLSYAFKKKSNRYF